MGKKTRKTRWRTFAITDESDSEESNTLSGSQLSKSYHHRPFYSKFTYSSHSTPTRRFPYEPKSTRSSSTASETKITFNEDEYTKITTPRQDVLFKKGYLNKPKNYQTQTSTGNSTASTGNSTGNGTPDHQSADGTEGTDLEYESQFVFPNAFVDQHGICYINSYEHYPLVMYNPQICYPEYPLSRTKRHSIGSLTESTSPHTEETSQDLSQSGGENTGNGPEVNHVYNVVYPGYYFNGVCSPNVNINGQTATEPRKIKKKRRRKVSKSVNQEGSTSSEDGYSSDEAITQVENRVKNTKDTTVCISTSVPSACPTLNENDTVDNVKAETKHIPSEKPSETDNEDNKEIPEIQIKETASKDIDGMSKKEDDGNEKHSILHQEKTTNSLPEKSLDNVNENDTIQNLSEDKSTLETQVNEKTTEENSQSQNEISNRGNEDEDTEDNITESNTENSEQPAKESKFNLNAEEFIPRAYRTVEPIPVEPNLQFINIHPNFLPLPLINHPLNELTPQAFNAPFLPPGIPLNFVAADPKLLPNFVNFVPNHFIPPKPYEQQPPNPTQPKTEDIEKKDEQDKSNKIESKTENANEIKKENQSQEEVKEEKVEIEKSKAIVYKNEVDIAKIVSKLEEAAKEQKLFENRRQNFRSPNKFNKSPRQRFSSPYQNEYKQDTYRPNFDKRKIKRFESKQNDSTESKQNDTSTTSAQELSERSETLQTKSEESQTDFQTKIRTKEVNTKPIEVERKYSPKFQNYKAQNTTPKKYMNYNRNLKSRTPEISHSSPTSNYSDTLKRSPYSKSCPRFEKHAADRSNPANKSATGNKIEELNREVSKAITLTKTTQWISVSNRKKRKNKSVNEDDIENVNTSFENSDEAFEKEDNSQLDVQRFENENDDVSIEKDPEEKNLPSSNKIDSFIEMIANTESSPIKVCSKTDIPDGQILQDVKDIEKELLKSTLKTVEEVQKETVEKIPEIKHEESPQIQTKHTKELCKKKTKKSNVKTTTKRIIILDPDTSKEENQQKDKPKPKTEVVKATKDNTKSNEVTKELIDEQIKINSPKLLEPVTNDALIENVILSKEEAIENNTLTPSEITTTNTSPLDKKKLKKKKKQVKPSLSTSIPSVSSSSTTLNTVDDSYDFLLDTTALIDEKTNIEVSEELDKMIQKGLFGNLEEKFRSLNVSVDDDFFKSLSLRPKTQSTPEKGFIKATNFTTILNNANQVLSKTKTGDEQNKIDIDFSKIKLPDYEPQPSTSKTGDFLEDPGLEVDPGPSTSTEVTLSTKSNGKLKNKSKKNILSFDTETSITSNQICQTEPPNRKEENEITSKNENEIFKNDDISTNHEKVTKNELILTDAIPKNEKLTSDSDALKCKSQNDETEIQTFQNQNLQYRDIQSAAKVEDYNKKSNAISDISFEIFESDNDFINDKEINKNSLLPTYNGCIYETNDVNRHWQSRYSDSNSEKNDVVIVPRAFAENKKPCANMCNGYANHYTENAKNEDFHKQNLQNESIPKENLMEEHIIIKIEHELDRYEPENLTDSQLKNEFLRGNITIEIEDEPNEKRHLELILKNEESQKDSLENCNDTKPLYPITQAVKEWMTKTRETTPEIEILKSPDTIYKEFIVNSDEDSDTEYDQKNGKSNPSPVKYLDQNEIRNDCMGARVAKADNEEEIPIFETWNVPQDDLLNSWEPKITEIKKEDVSRKNIPIEEAEDVLEVYESKYGKNEDFLRLKAEIEEQRKNGTFPKHGNLPYRAICCSLM